MGKKETLRMQANALKTKATKIKEEVLRLKNKKAEAQKQKDRENDLKRLKEQLTQSILDTARQGENCCSLLANCDMSIAEEVKKMEEFQGIEVELSFDDDDIWIHAKGW